MNTFWEIGLRCLLYPALSYRLGGVGWPSGAPAALSYCSVPTSLWKVIETNGAPNVLSSPPEHEDQLIILVKGWIGVGPSKGLGVGVEEGGELSQMHPAIHLKVFISLIIIHLNVYISLISDPPQRLYLSAGQFYLLHCVPVHFMPLIDLQSGILSISHWQGAAGQ